ncbi:dTDP-4-dehydrorhamnose reductase [bacterium]|nr:dTDP-4-dehydrorhamnose reductase [bacterium]
MKKILLIGKNGMLGSVFALNEVKLNGDLFAVDIDEIDITKNDSVIDIFEKIKPNLLINCSAYTNVDGAETDKVNCNTVNVDGVKNLTLACRKHNTFMVHYSTDFVFNGSKKIPYEETDATSPLCYYGLTKLNGEKAITELLDESNYLIIRTSWLFGPRGNNFIKKIIQLAKEKPQLDIVDDQKGRPAYTKDLAQAAVNLINAGASGIFHIANSGECSWFELARYALDCCGLNEYKTYRTTSDKFVTPAKRPLYSVLSTKKYEKVCGTSMRSWKKAVHEYITDYNL